MTTPIQENDLDYAKRVLKNLADEFWSIHEQYKNNQFLTTEEIRLIFQDYSAEVGGVLELLEQHKGGSYE